MTPDNELLRRYAEGRSEAAFAELVQRHVNLVYSAALRQVNGDAHLAQDVAQTVFTDLARKAGALSRRAVLTGWLYTSAHFAAAKAARSEHRRHAHEQEAQTMRELLHDSAPELDWDQLRPVLDAAMHELKESDREAILLRYFEKRPFGEVGAKLGLSENAARMRVDRAVEKLRALLARRGVTTAVAALSTVISAHAVQAAPAGLAVSLSSAAVAAALAGTGTTLSLLKLMTLTKLQIGIVSTIAVAALAAPMMMQHRSIANLREENQTLEQQTAQLASLQTENERLSNLAVQGNTATPSSENQVRELARLRNEVGLLRDQTNRLAKETKENRRADAQASFSAFADEKQIFHNISMAEFAKFIAGVLQAPVADQTGLTGTYDIALTPPRNGGDDGQIERVSRILLNELGLKMVAFAGPFTSEQEDFISPVVYLPDGTTRRIRGITRNADGTAVVQFPDGTKMNAFVNTNASDGGLRPQLPDGKIKSVLAMTQPHYDSSATNGGGFAIKLDHSDAPGLKVSRGDARR